MKSLVPMTLIAIVLSNSALCAVANLVKPADFQKVAPPNTLTFNKDIAPIVHQNCTVCHRPGEIGPFSLISYDDVKKRAKQVGIVTGQRSMPPWKAEQNFGDFANARRLSDVQIATIQQWADEGAAEGKPEDKKEAPKFPEGWQLGKPDLVLTMEKPYTVPAEGRDDYHCFIILANIPSDVDISAIEYRPSNRKVVHHIQLYQDVTGSARKRETKGPGSGIPGSAGLGQNWDGWAPSAQTPPLPPGIVKVLKKGADLVLELHLHPTGKPEQEQTSIGFYFSKVPRKDVVTTVPVAFRQLDIPAGEKAYKVSATFTVPVNSDLIAVFPHAHYLGKDIKAQATLPDGTKKPLIWISDWDFNWQGQYRYATPLRLPKGSRVDVDFTFDNSAENPNNPSRTPRRVTWGEQTTNEMAILYLMAVPAR